MVSDCDYLFLSGYRWYYDKNTGYYKCSNYEIWNGHQINSKRIHWFVAQLMGLKIPKGYQIDHIDRNKPNNQRNNLRAVSRRLQMCNKNMLITNTSGYTGVYFKNDYYRNKPWVACIKLANGKSKHLGYFKTSKEASEVYQDEKRLRDEKEINRCKTQ